MKTLNEEQLLLVLILEMQLENHGEKLQADVRMQRDILGFKLYHPNGDGIPAIFLTEVVANTIRFACDMVGVETLTKWLGGYKVTVENAKVSARPVRFEPVINVFNLNDILIASVALPTPSEE